MEDYSLNFRVVEIIKYPRNANIHKQVIAMFAQASDAVIFAKKAAKERDRYDNKTPFEYQVTNRERTINRYYNIEPIV